MDHQKELVDAFAELDETLVLQKVQDMVNSGEVLDDIIKGLNEGIARVSERFEKGEYFIGDLIISGMLYNSALQIISPYTDGNPAMRETIGRIVIGVVEGDIHDIGKDIMVNILRSQGFDVIDLGVDVKPQRFAYAIETYQPDILLLSGVLSIAQQSMEETMKLLRARELKDKTAVYMGGACATETLCHIIGADGWGYDVMHTVNFCKEVVRKKHEQQ